MIYFKNSGNFSNTERFLTRARQMDIKRVLAKYGPIGVNALASATPVDTGLTANSWNYSLITSRSSFSISWNNTNIKNGVPVVILIQYGHGTRGGGYVSGIDFINPAMKPIFDQISEEILREVSQL